MSFIDWSDSEGMFGLLIDFVVDERADCHGDQNRRRFLEELLEQLQTLEAELAEIAASVAIQKLKDIHGSTEREFSHDPVIIHLRDCIEELERVDRDGAA